MQPMVFNPRIASWFFDLAGAREAMPSVIRDYLAQEAPSHQDSRVRIDHLKCPVTEYAGFGLQSASRSERTSMALRRAAQEKRE